MTNRKPDAGQKELRESIVHDVDKLNAEVDRGKLAFRHKAAKMA